MSEKRKAKSPRVRLVSFQLSSGRRWMQGPIWRRGGTSLGVVLISGRRTRPRHSGSSPAWPGVARCGQLISWKAAPPGPGPAPRLFPLLSKLPLFSSPLGFAFFSTLIPQEAACDSVESTVANRLVSDTLTLLQRPYREHHASPNLWVLPEPHTSPQPAPSTAPPALVVPSPPAHSDLASHHITAHSRPSPAVASPVHQNNRPPPPSTARRILY